MQKLVKGTFFKTLGSALFKQSFGCPLWITVTSDKRHHNADSPGWRVLVWMWLFHNEEVAKWSSPLRLSLQNPRQSPAREARVEGQKTCQCADLGGHYMRLVWTQTGTNSDRYGVITWDRYESNKWLHETGMTSDRYDNSTPFVRMLKTKISDRSEISLRLHGKNCRTGLTYSCRFSSRNESNRSEVIFWTGLM